jgi:hypothetical protein
MLIPKSPSLRSKKLRNSARGQDCTMQVVGVCNFNSETTVLAHLDSENKGTAYKSSDLFAVYACSDCHSWLDQHKGNKEDRLFYSLRALDRTHRIMTNTGLICA